MNRGPKQAHTRGGFTLLEMTIAAALIALIFLVLGSSSRRAGGAFSAGMISEELAAKARRSMDTCMRSLAELELGALGNLSLGDNTITYHRAVNYDAGAEFGPDISLAFEYEAGEVDDGLDNDGDGLIDEGQLVMTRDLGLASEQRVILCKGVSELLEGETSAPGDENGNGFFNESGFFIDVQGAVITVRLTLQGIDSNGQLHTSSIESSTRVRN